MKKTSKIISVFLVFLIIFSAAATPVQAASASEIRAKVISVAEKEIGYKGTGSYSKYGEWYGYQGGWCTTFVLWVFNKAGQALDVDLYSNIVPSGGNCNSMISWFKNKGRYHTFKSGYKPKKGDLVFFDWSGNGSSQHVGIVDYTDGSTVYTIEGNCSAKVKARKYTSSGKKPYNNISAIMGYGSPDFDKVANGKSKSTTKKAKKKKTTPKTTKKATKKVTKSVAKHKPKKPASKSKKAKVKPTAENKTAVKTTTAVTKKKIKTDTVKPVKAMELYAATTDLQIGDSVQLDYSLKPANTKAVVGYFCDEENIIEISNGGVITAVGEGVATVVVCANDEIYSQCDFTVTQPSGAVTKYGKNNELVLAVQNESTTLKLSKKTNEQILSDIGINIKMLQNNKQYYIMPLAVLCSTLVLSGLIALIKHIAAKKRKKDKD